MKNNRSLISALKDLYSQLSKISWGMTQFRLNTYKRDSKPRTNITSLLHKQIEEIGSKTSQQEYNKAVTTHENETTQAHNGEDKIQKGKETKLENVTGVESEFVKYVKQRRPAHVTQPQMGESLKASAWQHINAAKRCAKSGNMDKAKLHIDIAGTALEEAGDYMSNEDYTELVLQIEGCFTEALK